MKDKEFFPTIAVTMGDPSGIGPEIIVKAISDKELFQNANWIICGSEEAFLRASKALGKSFEYVVHSKILPYGIELPRLSLLDVAPGDYLPLLGKPEMAGGKWAGKAISAAVELSLKKVTSAIVTAPLAKSNLIEAGFDFPGHTEMLASLCGVKNPIMILVSGNLRVAIFTRHIALRRVFSFLKVEPLAAFLTTLATEIKKWFGIKKPRITLLGLNPHSGEDGLFGTEEKSIMVPAIEKVAKKVEVLGPIPADTAFSPDIIEQSDVIVSMFHDQGLGPFKALAFNSGVNVTLNLPFIRTSPDHGTAFGIADKYCANPQSMKEAMRLAVQVARRV